MPKRKVRVETYVASTRVPKSFMDEIENLVKEGYYIDSADYLRDIIRKDLLARGRLKRRSVSGTEEAVASSVRSIDE